MSIMHGCYKCNYDNNYSMNIVCHTHVGMSQIYTWYVANCTEGGRREKERERETKKDKQREREVIIII